MELNPFAYLAFIKQVRGKQWGTYFQKYTKKRNKETLGSNEVVDLFGKSLTYLKSNKPQKNKKTVVYPVPTKVRPQKCKPKSQTKKTVVYPVPTKVQQQKCKPKPQTKKTDVYPITTKVQQKFKLKQQTKNGQQRTSVESKNIMDCSVTLTDVMKCEFEATKHGINLEKNVTTIILNRKEKSLHNANDKSVLALGLKNKSLNVVDQHNNIVSHLHDDSLGRKNDSMLKENLLKNGKTFKCTSNGIEKENLLPKNNLSNHTRKPINVATNKLIKNEYLETTECASITCRRSPRLLNKNLRLNCVAAATNGLTHCNECRETRSSNMHTSCINDVKKENPKTSALNASSSISAKSKEIVSIDRPDEDVKLSCSLFYGQNRPNLSLSTDSVKLEEKCTSVDITDKEEDWKDISCDSVKQIKTKRTRSSKRNLKLNCFALLQKKEAVTEETNSLKIKDENLDKLKRRKLSRQGRVKAESPEDELNGSINTTKTNRRSSRSRKSRNLDCVCCQVETKQNYSLEPNNENLKIEAIQNNVEESCENLENASVILDGKRSKMELEDSLVGVPSKRRKCSPLSETKKEATQKLLKKEECKDLESAALGSKRSKSLKNVSPKPGSTSLKKKKDKAVKQELVVVHTFFKKDLEKYYPDLIFNQSKTRPSENFSFNTSRTRSGTNLRRSLRRSDLVDFDKSFETTKSQSEHKATAPKSPKDDINLRRHSKIATDNTCTRSTRRTRSLENLNVISNGQTKIKTIKNQSKPKIISCKNSQRNSLEYLLEIPTNDTSKTRLIGEVRRSLRNQKSDNSVVKQLEVSTDKISKTSHSTRETRRTLRNHNFVDSSGNDFDQTNSETSDCQIENNNITNSSTGVKKSLRKQNLANSNKVKSDSNKIQTENLDESIVVQQSEISMTSRSKAEPKRTLRNRSFINSSDNDLEQTKSDISGSQIENNCLVEQLDISNTNSSVGAKRSSQLNRKTLAQITTDNIQSKNNTLIKDAKDDNMSKQQSEITIKNVSKKSCRTRQIRNDNVDSSDKSFEQTRSETTREIQIENKNSSNDGSLNQFSDTSQSDNSASVSDQSVTVNQEIIAVRNLVENEFKSDLGYKVYKRYEAQTLAKQNKEHEFLYWNHAVKEELLKLSKSIPLKQLLGYMNWSIDKHTCTNVV